MTKFLSGPVTARFAVIALIIAFTFSAFVSVVSAGTTVTPTLPPAVSEAPSVRPSASPRPERSARPTRPAQSESPSVEASVAPSVTPTERPSATSPSVRPDRSARPGATETPVATGPSVRPERSARPTSVVSLPVTGTGSSLVSQQLNPQTICTAAFQKYAPIRYTWQSLDASLNRLGCNLAPNLTSAVPVPTQCASIARTTWNGNRALTEYQVRDRVLNSGICGAYEDGSYYRL